MKRLIAVGCGGLVLIAALALVFQTIIEASEPRVLKMFSNAATAVSEPATLSLLGVAFLGGAWLARRRRGKAPSQI